jgi:hypothetical protein
MLLELKARLAGGSRRVNQKRLAEVIKERDEAREQVERLRSAYRRALEQLALMRRRIFVAKAERAETAGLQMAFDALLEQAKQMQAQLGERTPSLEPAETEQKDDDTANPSRDKGQDQAKSHARRQLAESALPVVRVEITDPDLEGVAERIGFEESYRLGYQRGGPLRILVARAIYKVALTVEPDAPVAADSGASGSELVSDGANPAVAASVEAEPAASVADETEEVVTAAVPQQSGVSADLGPQPSDQLAPAGHADPAAGVGDKPASAMPPSPGCPRARGRREGHPVAPAQGQSGCAGTSEAGGTGAAGADERCRDTPPQRCRGPTQQGRGDTGSERTFTLVTAAVPKELIRRALLAPSMIAHLLVSKYMMGVPFYRLEQKFALEGFPLDRGMMCRYAEDVGATLGAIVLAARAEAFAHAFCLSTDATGVLVQPPPSDDGKRQACRKGHFFVILADKDHIFFEYTKAHTSAAVTSMFKGFTGYIQADAHAVYDALFRGNTDQQTSVPQDSQTPTEVGCMVHARRRFWDAAVCKYEIGLEGLRRIDAMFAVDRPLWSLPPAQRKARRDILLRPMVDAFFAWAKAQHAVTLERGLVLSALGYVIRQEQPLRRFLDDGRLRMENNSAERQIRPIACARKAWLFFGSDDHAQAAANLFSLIASCKLYGLDPETYLADVIRLMPYWPRDRYLELSPKYWARTRSTLRPEELALPIGHITVPPPVAAEEQSVSH